MTTPSPEPMSLEDAIAQIQSGRSIGSSSVGRVYMGREEWGPRPNDSGPKYASIEEAASKWYYMSLDEQAALGRRMQRGGLVSDPSDFKQLTAAWVWAVKQSAASGKDMTPWDVIGMAETMGSHGGGGVSGRSAGPRTITQRQRNLDIPSQADAEAAAKTIFRELVGRDPDKAELARFSSVIIGTARKNPSTTTTTSNYGADGSLSSSSSVTTGGIGAAGLQEAVARQVRVDPEFAAYQAATTYFDAALKAVEAPV